MARPPLFLLGGGRLEAAFVRTLWPLVRAAGKPTQRRIAVVVPRHAALSDEDAIELARAPLQLFKMRCADLPVLMACADDPLTAERLAALEPTAVMLASAPAPACHAALCTNLSWTAALVALSLPCAAVGSAAMMMSEHAIIGGSKLGLRHADVSTCVAWCADGLEYVTLRPGAARVPFTIEVHATQRGSLTRLQHAVAEGLVESGWAVDEDTVLQVDDDGLQVHGFGHAYRVLRLARGSVRIDTCRAGWRSLEAN